MPKRRQKKDNLRRRGNTLVHTEGLDGEELTYDPAALLAAISSRELESAPEAELVAGALVLSWMQESIKNDPERWAGSLGPDTTEEEYDAVFGMILLAEGEEDLKNFIAWLKEMHEVVSSPIDGQHR